MNKCTGHFRNKRIMLYGIIAKQNASKSAKHFTMKTDTDQDYFFFKSDLSQENGK